MEVIRRHLLVAALKFGTSNSGCAFSWKHEFEKDPLNIHLNELWRTGLHIGISTKTSTCLLLNNEKQFVAFGYDAENRYAELVMVKEHANYYFFDRFTTSLHSNENVTRDMVLKDKTGKTCSAVEVFTLSIKYIVDHFMEELKIIYPKLRVFDIVDDMLWVLTVSAAWTDSAKQLMRESAEKAGINPEKLLLVNEPEAAFTYCHYRHTERLQGSKLGNMIKEPGTKSMVVDLGGMTADITVLQQTFCGELKVLCRVTGDDCGGTSVDDRFLKIIEEIAGEKVISELKEKDSSYIDLVKEIETLKRRVRTENKTKVNITIPYAAINEKCQEYGGKSLQSAIDSSSYVNEVTVLGDKMRFSADLIIKLFTPTIDSIINLMKNTVSNRSTNGVSNNVSNIVMVGGLSECPIIQDAVHKAFPDNQIINPVKAELSILNGAVLFGHQPDYIWSDLRDEEGIGK